jgi:hypothetical protein
MKSADLKKKHFSEETIAYEIVIDLYSEPNKGGNMSRYALKGFKKGFVILSGVYDPNIKLYVNLTNAIKAGQKIYKYYKNCEVYICGVDYKGGKNFVKLNEIQ